MSCPPSGVRRDSLRGGSVRHGSAQYRPVQPSMSQYGPVQPGTARNGPAQPGMSRNSPARPRRGLTCGSGRPGRTAAGRGARSAGGPRGTRPWGGTGPAAPGSAAAGRPRAAGRRPARGAAGTAGGGQGGVRGVPPPPPPPRPAPRPPSAPPPSRARAAPRRRPPAAAGSGRRHRAAPPPTSRPARTAAPPTATAPPTRPRPPRLNPQHGPALWPRPYPPRPRPGPGVCSAGGHLCAGHRRGQRLTPALPAREGPGGAGRRRGPGRGGLLEAEPGAGGAARGGGGRARSCGGLRGVRGVRPVPAACAAPCGCRRPRCVPGPGGCHAPVPPPPRPARCLCPGRTMGTPRAAPLLPLLLLLPAACAAPRDGGHRSEAPPATRPDPGPDPLSPEPPALQLLRSAVRSLGQPEQDAEDMTREQALLYLFALYDHDRSGRLDGLELLQLLGAVLAQGGMGQPSPEAVAVLVDRALERQDRSGDGLLDPPELLLPGGEKGPPGEPLVGAEARQRCRMERQLRELRLQEERDFLQRVAWGAGTARALPDTEPPLGRPHRRGTAIVPEPLASDALLQLPSSPLSQRDLSLIAEAMGRSDFLRRLGEGCPEALAQSFVPVQHGPGDTVLAEGDEGNAMYIVAEGQLSVTQRGRQLRTLGPGDVFGELAILYHCKRTATVQALSPVRLWAIDRQRYRAITTSSAKQRRAKVLDSLRTVHWLQDLSDSHLSKLLDAMEECSFAPGHVIIREGDEGESFYIILKGQVGAVPRGRAVPPIPLSLAPRPLAGAGEPAGGRAREAAACAGCWRALRGALAAGEHPPDSVMPGAGTRHLHHGGQGGLPGDHPLLPQARLRRKRGCNRGAGPSGPQAGLGVPEPAAAVPGSAAGGPGGRALRGGAEAGAARRPGHRWLRQGRAGAVPRAALRAEADPQGLGGAHAAAGARAHGAAGAGPEPLPLHRGVFWHLPGQAARLPAAGVLPGRRAVDQAARGVRGRGARAWGGQGCAVQCRDVLCCAMPCWLVWCRALPCRAMPCSAMPCSAVPCRAVPCRAVPHCAVPSTEPCPAGATLRSRWPCSAPPAWWRAWSTCTATASSTAT
uniref:Cyclic nucleotide-binding domain-containing protein n=1 Tax=Cairina moschata TaxID=8855 RepID=A0A8C3BQS7_CAIMO